MSNMVHEAERSPAGAIGGVDRRDPCFAATQRKPIRPTGRLLTLQWCTALGQDLPPQRRDLGRCQGVTPRRGTP